MPNRTLHRRVVCPTGVDPSDGTGCYEVADEPSGAELSSSTTDSSSSGRELASTTSESAPTSAASSSTAADSSSVDNATTTQEPDRGRSVQPPQSSVDPGMSVDPGPSDTSKMNNGCGPMDPTRLPEDIRPFFKNRQTRDLDKDYAACVQQADDFRRGTSPLTSCYARYVRAVRSSWYEIRRQDRQGRRVRRGIRLQEALPARL